MKIALLNTFYYPVEPGGAERSIKSLAEGLTAEGHEVVIICLGEKRQTETINNVVVERIPIHNLYLPSPGYDERRSSWKRLLWHLQDANNERGARAVASCLAHHQPSVLHTNNLSGFSTSVWRAAKALRIRVVHTARDFYLLCPKTTMMKSGLVCKRQCFQCRLLSRPKLSNSRYVDQFVFISEYMKQRHCGSGLQSISKASIIYNSYDPTRISPIPAAGHRTVIGFIGRLDRTKGIELLLKAFSILTRDDGLQLSLRVAGAGPRSYLRELKSLASDLPVEFLGQVAASEFFNQIDMTVVPSIWNEPLGRVAIESIAHGRGVVVTPVGGLPELVESSYGVVSRSLSEFDLADAMRVLIERLKRDSDSISRNALSAAQKHTSRQIAKLYITAYQ